jgi:chromosome segregation ATPase
MNNHAPRPAIDPNGSKAAAVQEWGDDALRQEMERLAAGNRELRAAVANGRPHGEAGDGEEVQRLRGENAELRQRVEELELALLERPETEDDWAERQREYEALLEEKSEVIRNLHQKIQELREAAASAPSGPARGGAADPATAQELVAAKRELEEERAQLEEDAQALEQQMRQMEMAMSRERAELARQRTELTRLHNDLRHEMEQAARDAVLKERLQPLQRRQQEVSTTRRVPSLVEINLPAPEPKVENQAANAKKPASGLFRRMFGQKQD